MVEDAIKETSEDEWAVGSGLSASGSFCPGSPPRIRLRTRALFDLLWVGLSAMSAWGLWDEERQELLYQLIEDSTIATVVSHQCPSIGLS
jgi:hypothetical protein